MWTGELEKISNIDIYLFIEKGLRVGISYIAKRHSKPNNKYIKKCDTTKPPEYISYLDMNNLYYCGRSGYLPDGGFKGLKDVANFDVNSISEKSPVGHILEVNLEYPDKLCKLRDDYLLAPEKLAIPYDVIRLL